MSSRLSPDVIGLRDLRSAPEEATAIDIVAIHGTGAHPDDTWCANIGTAEDPRWVNWLTKEDMLPADAPNARIMRYGYESQWFGDEAMRSNVSIVALRLLIALKRARRAYPYRPLIFIAHCFGGLVVLKALIEARNDKTAYPGMFESTTGIAFFGTPFRGAEEMSQVKILEVARKYQESKIQTEILKVFEPGNEILQDVVDQFSKIRRETKKAWIACFYELKYTNIGEVMGQEDRKEFLVDQASACLDSSESTTKFSLSRTHFDMIKFGRPSEEDFQTVRDVIQKMVARSSVDKEQLETRLEYLALGRGETLNWKTSVVDLLKLLGRAHDLNARKQLADELDVHVADHGTAKQNNALRNAIMQALGANEWEVPSKTPRA